VPVAGGRSVDWAAQVEVSDNGFRPEVKVLGNEVVKNLLVDLSRAKGFYGDGKGMSHTDNIGNLNLCPFGQPGGYDVLGDVAGSISGGAVNLGGVFS